VTTAESIEKLERQLRLLRQVCFDDDKAAALIPVVKRRLRDALNRLRKETAK
jgi:hypothetical protein